MQRSNKHPILQLYEDQLALLNEIKNDSEKLKKDNQSYVIFVQNNYSRLDDLIELLDLYESERNNFTATKIIDHLPLLLEIWNKFEKLKFNAIFSCDDEKVSLSDLENKSKFVTLTIQSNINDIQCSLQDKYELLNEFLVNYNDLRNNLIKIFNRIILFLDEYMSKNDSDFDIIIYKQLMRIKSIIEENKENNDINPLSFKKKNEHKKLSSFKGTTFHRNKNVTFNNEEKVRCKCNIQ